MARIARLFKKNILRQTLFAPRIAIDLGSSVVRMYIKESDQSIDFPSLLAIHLPTQTVLAVGAEAKKMIGKSPKDIQISHPVKLSRIIDIDEVALLIQHGFDSFKTSLNPFALFQPHLFFFIQPSTTQVQYNAWITLCRKLGVIQYTFFNSALIAVLGSSKDFFSTSTTMIVDINYDQTTICVVFAGRLTLFKTFPLGNTSLRKAVQSHIRSAFNLEVGEDVIDEMKHSMIDVAHQKEHFYVIRGRDLVAGVPRTIKVSSHELGKVVAEFADSIVKIMKDTFQEVPAELMTDIVHSGIHLTGEIALLEGLKVVIEKEFGTFVHMSANPEKVYIQGVKKVLDDPEILSKVVFKPYW